MLTQYDELRVARGRTLALEHDTTEDDFSLRSSFGIVGFSLDFTSLGIRRARRGVTDLEETSVTTQKSRRRVSTDLEHEVGAVDMEPGELLPFGEDESRVSEIELARGDLRASRSSILSKRVSGYSLGSRFEEDELPAFGEHEIGIEAPKISFGGESMIGADIQEAEMGGFDVFHNALDESSQRTSEISAIREEKQIRDEEVSRRSDRERASFRLSLLMGEEGEEEGFLFSPRYLNVISRKSSYKGEA